jgi:putative phosphoesterase
VGLFLSGVFRLIIGVLSDTHLVAVDDSFRDLITRHFLDVDAVIHAGDMVGLCVPDFLSRWELFAVSGNMDDWEVAERFPPKRIVGIGGRRIGITHGHGSPPGLPDRVWEEFKGDAVDCVVFGHTHASHNETRGGILLFNPGSPTDKRFAKKNTLGFLTISADDIRGEIREI